MIITIILLSLALAGPLYIIHNLLRKYEQGEEYIENLETWVREFSKTITDMNKEITKIDTKGSFSSDDEVGYFFKELKSIIQKLDTLGEEDDTTSKR
jgi:ABC-type Zn uptake system ZnuABC Zn-binding protein ZnuA